VTEANAALLVANDDQRCECEVLTALHDLGDAVDGDELIDEFTFSALFVAAAAIAVVTAWAATVATGAAATSAARATWPTASAAAWAAAARAARASGPLI
jgi:hypothetical protein